MIIYTDIMKRLSDAGYTSYKIQKDKLIPHSTLTRIRLNQPVSTATIDTICRLCSCQPGDLMVWQPEKEEN